MPFHLIPPGASANAGDVDAIFWALTGLSVFILCIVFAPLAFFAIKYRRGSNADRTPSLIPTWKFEITWTIIPFVIGMGIFAWAAEAYFQIETPPSNALQVDVVGKQWMWKLQHQEGNREINELHVPLGRPIELMMTSQDVIHDFSIPAFRVKQDVVPGRYTTEWFTPTKVGRYHIFCAQFCGTSHASMIGWVDVLMPGDYQKWLATSGQGVTMAAQGATLFHQLGCSGCHEGSSTIHAPRLEGVYGNPVPLQGGQTVIADDKYIRDCILLPSVQVPAGYQPLMPSFSGRVSEEEIMQLVAYIKSIAGTSPPASIQ